MIPLYELLHPFGVVAGQHVVDNISGDSLNERWTTGNFTGGTPVFTMIDGIDEGFEIDSGSSSANKGGFIAFNGIRQYDNTLVALIASMKFMDTTVILANVGLQGDSPNFTKDRLESRLDTNTSSNILLLTKDASTSSSVDSGLAADTNWHTHDLKLDSIAAKQWIDGTFKGIKTTNLPTTALEPTFFVVQRGTTSKEARIRYIEVYNIA